MKMTNDLYEYFDITINETLEDIGIVKVKQYRNGVAYTDNQFNAFCWGVYQLTNRQNSHQLGDMAKKQDLEDSHMLTAIQKVLKAFK